MCVDSGPGSPEHIDRAALIESWRDEEQHHFSGWDFSHLDGRMLEETPPWSYMERAAGRMRRSESMVDLGTGGAERLLRLREHWPHKVAATEAYPPNLALAAGRLAPFGARVFDVALTDNGPMPFAAGEFDLILNRHAGFNPNEVARCLAPGGVFLTQQIHGQWAFDLLSAFGTVPQWPDSTLEKYLPRLKRAGLAIVAAESWSGRLAFTQVGAIVYYLKAVPWLVPGFSVATHLPCLLKLHGRLEAGEPLAFWAGKFLIEARK
jgi:SAM-dependent methyltransferase